MTAEPNSEVEHRFPCNSCGSDLRFDPAGRQLTCDHCGNTQQIGAANTAITELDYQAARDNALSTHDIAETRVTSCPNCGAQTEFDTDVHATECPFCATPVVTDTGTHRRIKPQAVLPFGLDEPTARAGVTNWLGSLWFAPNGLKEYARKGRKLNGIYVPYWTFDADTKSKYSGQRGTHYYETKTVMRDGKKTQVRVQKTRWKPKSGRVARFFDDVLVLASKSLPKHYTDGLQPWDLSSLVPYQPEYLAGFRAEGYQIEINDGYTEARAHMDAVIHRDVKSDIGGDEQRINKVNTNVSDVTFKHILLPVWLAAYKYRGKTYRFVVNGRTGEVQGERPYSRWKIGGVVVVILAIIAGIVIANSQ
jgi:DNA-directed RNA polymerase subunit RPC12/RpoP